MQQKKRRIIAIVFAAVALAAFIWVGVFAATYYPRRAKDTANYLAEITAVTVYDNAYKDALPQTVAYGIISDHFEHNTSGKIPKLLFIGYDGCQAVMPEINKDNERSALRKVAAGGGLYFAYAGGANGSSQDTSTAPGWAAILTGVWATENGVYSNGNVLKEKTRSIIYQLGATGVETGFSVSWAPHFTRTYKKEVASVKDKGYPVSYLLNSDDEGTYNSMLTGIRDGDSAVFGILEYTDRTGHGSGFDKNNSVYKEGFLEQEEKAYLLIQEVEARESYAQEDWLIMITSDHGGYKTSHGDTTPMEYLTFLAVNKTIE